MRKKSFIRQNVLPLVAALIWGTGFVAQSESTDFVPPFAFNSSRSFVAVIVLLIISVIFAKVQKKRDPAAIKKEKPRDLAVGGVCCGSMLFLASYLQQLGIGGTSAGKAGFITALYVVLVPIFGIFVKRRAPFVVWIGAVFSVAGLYFLCIKEDFSISPGDFQVFLCAIAFAFHILIIDHFVEKVDGIHLSCVQFLTVAVLSAIFSLIFETPDFGGIFHCLPQILYLGIFSSGIAYTLQIVAQKDSDPTVVTILLSLESVFAVLAGAVILGDKLTGREYLGCVLMFIAVLLAQIPFPTKKKGTV